MLPLRKSNSEPPIIFVCPVCLRYVNSRLIDCKRQDIDGKAYHGPCSRFAQFLKLVEVIDILEGNEDAFDRY